jgi:hypothetical protein
MNQIIQTLLKIKTIKLILGKLLLINTKIFWKYLSNANKDYKFISIKPDTYLHDFFIKEKNIGNVVELGSGYGDKLYNLHKLNILKLKGYELNESKVLLGKNLIKNLNIKNIELITKDITNLTKSDFGDVDYFITSMSLIYLKKKELVKILEIILHKSKRGFVLQEFSKNSKNLTGKTFYVHDYKDLFNQMGFYEKFNIEFNPIDYSYWKKNEGIAYQMTAKKK